MRQDLAEKYMDIRMALDTIREEMESYGQNLIIGSHLTKERREEEVTKYSNS